MKKELQLEAIKKAQTDSHEVHENSDIACFLTKSGETESQDEALRRAVRTLVGKENMDLVLNKELDLFDSKHLLLVQTFNQHTP